MNQHETLLTSPCDTALEVGQFVYVGHGALHDLRNVLHCRPLTNRCLLLFQAQAPGASTSQAKRPEAGLTSYVCGGSDVANEVNALQKPRCVTCQLTFPSQDALQSHYDKSLSHRWCVGCRLGFDSPVSLANVSTSFQSATVLTSAAH